MKKEKCNLQVVSGGHFSNSFPSVCMDGWASLKSEYSNLECPCKTSFLSLQENKLQVEEGYIKLEKIEKELLPALIKTLNDIHGVSYSERFWIIIIGHWYRRALLFIYKEYSVVISIMNQFDIQDVSLIDVKRDQIILENYIDFGKKNKKDYFKSYVVEKIIENIGYGRLISKNIISITEENATTGKSSFLLNIFKKLLYKISNFFSLFASQRSPVITQTYLSSFSELLFNLKFLNLPRFFPNFDYAKKNINHNYRNSLKNTLISYKNNSDEDLFKNIMASLIPDIFPKAYLEDFKSITSSSKLLKLPRNPRFILTANRFLTDEVFKAYIALKSEEGVPYFVLQHGSNYGEIKYLHPTIEEITSNSFFTWGWAYNNHHVRGFMFNKNYSTIRRNYNKDDKKSYLLFLEKGVYSSMMLENGSLLYKKYLESKVDFFYGIKDNIRKNLLVRPHLVTIFDEEYHEIERWRALNIDIEFDLSIRGFQKSVSISKLTVCFYHGTAFLEMLAANVPIVCYMDGLNTLSKNGEDAYKILFNAGICHKSPQSLAYKVNAHWDDVATWWYSSPIQNARNEFCSQHLRISKNPSSDLKRLVLSQL